MGKPKQGTSKVVIGNESLTEKMIEGSESQFNIAQIFITTTADKIKLCLGEHLNKISDQSQWMTPLGIFLTTLVTLNTSTSFKTFILPAEIWRDVFIMSSLFSFFWLIYSIFKAVMNRPKGIDELIEEMASGKGSSKQTLHTKEQQ